jgi:hypothetical protein
MVLMGVTTMGLSAQTQGALLRMRNRRVARQILQSLTAWSTGLTVTEGEYVSSENGTSPWLATSSGTTGATAPTGQGAFNDGGVQWVRADIQSLLTFKFTGAPTPA